MSKKHTAELSYSDLGHLLRVFLALEDTLARSADIDKNARDAAMDALEFTGKILLNAVRKDAFPDGSPDDAEERVPWMILGAVLHMVARFKKSLSNETSVEVKLDKTMQKAMNDGLDALREQLQSMLPKDKKRHDPSQN